MTMIQKEVFGISEFCNITSNNLFRPAMSRLNLDMNDNEPDAAEMKVSEDEIDLIKARIKENPVNGGLSNGDDECKEHMLTGWPKSHTPVNMVKSENSESLCLSTETLIDDISQCHINDGIDSETMNRETMHKERVRNHSGSETVIKSKSCNEIGLTTNVQSGLLISPSSLTQDIPVKMGSDNKRISSVLESLDLHLVYIPSTHQLVAGKAQEPVTVSENKTVASEKSSKVGIEELIQSKSSLDYKSDSTLSTPTKMATTDSSSLHSFTILSPSTLDDSSSICETDCLIKIKEPDQLTCDSSEFECNFPRINTNDSLLRTFTDASSLSSISTGTDFSVSAASLDEGETGMCIDTGDGGFMEINLHTRNSYERAKNPSQDSGFEDRSVKPKRKGLSAFLSRFVLTAKL